ncbi:hypothetical protein GLOIN_2v1790329 [Rhizophagus clarus]|uniref:Uncharacterized protein n=1 Tax=Rhizophagus clarus TaxID=94130 RepID=A0A8H3LT45_9GLOM|nr:hypothetical protein GLOIN_2v1790329 [Rhizophagus clarus]
MEPQRYPANQEQYKYAYCFCNQVCHKVIPGGISKYNYEYIVCNNEECEFIGVRCTTCLCLCKIFVLKEGNLFWSCNNNNQCNFFKQHVLVSLRNHIESCKSLLSINVKTLSEFIFRYVENLAFINILKKLYNYGKLNEINLNEIIEYLADESPGIVGVIKNQILFSTTPNRLISQDSINNIMNFQNISPTPNELGMLSSIDIIKLKHKFEAEVQDNFNEIRKD